MKRFVADEWTWADDAIVEQVRRRLPADAVIRCQRYEGGGLEFDARWTVVSGPARGEWRILQPGMCLWVELLGPGGLRWTSRMLQTGLDYWRVLRVAEAMDAITTER